MILKWCWEYKSGMSCLEIQFKSLNKFSSDKTETMGVEKNNGNTTMRPTKELKKIAMICFYQSDPTKRAYSKQIIKVWRKWR